jgi:hypothetical protein
MASPVFYKTTVPTLDLFENTQIKNIITESPQEYHILPLTAIWHSAGSSPNLGFNPLFDTFVLPSATSKRAQCHGDVESMCTALTAPSTHRSQLSPLPAPALSSHRSQLSALSSHRSQLSALSSLHSALCTLHSALDDGVHDDGDVGVWCSW